MGPRCVEDCSGPLGVVVAVAVADGVAWQPDPVHPWQPWKSDDERSLASVSFYVSYLVPSFGRAEDRPCHDCFVATLWNC
jgi:hypothetical protein